MKRGKLHELNWFVENHGVISRVTGGLLTTLFPHCVAFGDILYDYGILSPILLSSPVLSTSTWCAYFLCLHCSEFFILSVNTLSICISKSLEASNHICAVTFLQYLILLAFNLAINKPFWTMMISENIKWTPQRNNLFFLACILYPLQGRVAKWGINRTRNFVPVAWIHKPPTKLVSPFWGCVSTFGTAKGGMIILILWSLCPVAYGSFLFGCLIVTSNPTCLWKASGSPENKNVLPFLTFSLSHMPPSLWSPWFIRLLPLPHQAKSCPCFL